jgi:hypothetical protein
MSLMGGEYTDGTARPRRRDRRRKSGGDGRTGWAIGLGRVGDKAEVGGLGRNRVCVRAPHIGISAALPASAAIGVTLAEGPQPLVRVLGEDGPRVEAIIAKQDDAHQRRLIERVQAWVGGFNGG